MIVAMKVQAKNMRKNLIILATTVIMLAAVGAAILANANASNSIIQTSNLTTSSNTQTTQYIHPFFGLDQSQYSSDSIFLSNVTLPDNITLPGDFMIQGSGIRGMHGRHMMSGGQQFFESLTQNATLTTVEGSVVTDFRNMLILNTNSGQITVQIPREWSLGSQIISGTELFNGTFASSGQTVTLQVLKSDIVNNASFSINEMLCYAATNATGTTANAILPFNIQPTR